MNKKWSCAFSSILFSKYSQSCVHENEWALYTCHSRTTKPIKCSLCIRCTNKFYKLKLVTPHKAYKTHSFFPKVWLYTAWILELVRYKYQLFTRCRRLVVQIDAVISSRSLKLTVFEIEAKTIPSRKHEPSTAGSSANGPIRDKKPQIGPLSFVSQNVCGVYLCTSYSFWFEKSIDVAVWLTPVLLQWL